MPTSNFLFVFWLVSLVVGATACNPAAPPPARNRAGGDQASAIYLRCEYRVNPLGIDEKKPRLSWIIDADQRGWMQSAYRVLVASDPERLGADIGDLWDSGKVDSPDTIAIEYGGADLQSHQRCYWKVRSWDKKGKASPWSPSALWSMGLLAPLQWQGEWIGYDTRQSQAFRSRRPESVSVLEGCSWVWYPEGQPNVAVPAETRYFRRTISIPSNKKIDRAPFLVSADNRAVVFVNGERIASFKGWEPVRSFDLAEKLRPGDNVIAIAATNVGDGDNPAGLIGKLFIDYESDEPLTVFIDRSWKASSSDQPDWTGADFDDSQWLPAKEFALLGAEPWGYLGSDELILPPPTYLRKEFALNKPIARAWVHATALGIYELHLNGKRVGRDYFTPGWTDYDKRVYYNTYDVTDLLRAGPNAIGAVLADGWYAGYVGFGRNRHHYGEQTRLSVQLHVEYQDGSGQTVVTDGAWRAATGAIQEADFLMGETYDARRDITGWDRPGFDQAQWSPVEVVSAIDAQVQAYPGVTVRRFDEITPKTITEPTKGTYVFDLGQNFAGWVRLQVEGKPGDKIVLRFAERLNPDGTVYTENLRSARTTDTYICRGGGLETWEPRFTFHGFQYVELTGLSEPPGPGAITGIEVTSATPVVGSFACSDEMANTLYRNICQTQRANFIDIPTDCPQRDERLGWTGDAQVYIRTACMNSDAQAFFTKWLVDLDDGQRDDGQFPMVAPVKVAGDDGGPAWADAGVICPWTAYDVYGDIRFLQKHYPSMTQFIDFCKNRSTDDLLPPAEFHCFGDWLSINADTPKDVIYTAYFACSTGLTARAARALGKQADAAKYQALFEGIKAAFNQAYVSADGRIKGDTQCVYVMAIAYDLLDPEMQKLAAQHLVDDIESRGGHLSTGFVGTKDLMLVLAKIGRNDVAYRLFHNDTFPSWGFSIRQGATSIWERWDGWTPAGGFQDPGMNSFAHYSFGAVGQWMFENIGGITNDGPGFKRIVIRPQPGGKLTFAQTAYQSIQGRITTDWQLTEGNFNLQLTVPANTSATVYVPAKDRQSVTEGGQPAHRAQGVRFLRMEAGSAVFAVGSGDYAFVSSDVNI